MSRLAVRIFVDVLLVVVPLIVFLVLYIVEPTFERGFYCDDESLHYPYKDDTVTKTSAGLIAGGIPVVVIIVSEVLMRLQDLKTPKGKKDLSHSLYGHLGPFVAGFIFQQLTGEIAKHIIGRLRPHFLDLCKPRFRVGDVMKTCDDLDKPWTNYIVVDRDNETNFICDSAHNEGGVWDKTLHDSVKSFPSAHSAVAFYGMVFLAIYFHKRLNFSRHANIITIFLQMVCLVIAIAVALSRISDYKHHWSDVLAGSLLGLVTAILIAKYSDFILETAEDKPQDEEAPMSETQVDLIIAGQPDKNKQYED